MHRSLLLAVLSLSILLSTPVSTSVLIGGAGAQVLALSAGSILHLERCSNLSQIYANTSTTISATVAYLVRL